MSMIATALHRAAGLTGRVGRRSAGEEGFTMIVAMGVLLVTSLLITATFVALSGDAHLSQSDLDGKRAYYAARAGVDAFTYQMNQNSNYWTSCANDNYSGAVPGGTTGQTYAYAPVPANGATTCSSTNPIGSLIDTTTGTLRMKFTGTSGGNPSVSRGIVASYRKASPLDYLWYTQYEALDSSISGYTDCAVYYRVSGGRPSHCNINWVSGDVMNGPMYTMDQFLISGAPTFGRYPSDYIQSLAPSTICSAGCGGAVIKGTPQAGVSGVTAPSDNSGLLTDATNHGAVFSGTTTIQLNGDTATITNCPSGSSTAACNASTTVTLASTPIIYVSNAAGCNPPAYTPFGAGYPTNTGGNFYGCAGDVYVSGNYNSSLTIAAANNVVINGSLLANGTTGTPSGSSILGLVANQFVRVMHGVTARNSNNFSDCGSATEASGKYLSSPTIDAAILALQHSFIVDNFDCGAPSNTGNLNLNGALVQKFRGTVGTTGASGVATGYLKKYNYDNRLAVLLPPYLFDISTSGWLLSRQTLCVPAGSDPNTAC